jgi:hypothetical protein
MLGFVQNGPARQRSAFDTIVPNAVRTPRFVCRSRAQRVLKCDLSGLCTDQRCAERCADCTTKYRANEKLIKREGTEITAKTTNTHAQHDERHDRQRRRSASSSPTPPSPTTTTTTTTSDECWRPSGRRARRSTAAAATRRRCARHQALRRCANRGGVDEPANETMAELDDKRARKQKIETK